jgi:hypothetical protein
MVSWKRIVGTVTSSELVDLAGGIRGTRANLDIDEVSRRNVGRATEATLTLNEEAMISGRIQVGFLNSGAVSEYRYGVSFISWLNQNGTLAASKNYSPGQARIRIT